MTDTQQSNEERLAEIRARDKYIRGGSYGTLDDHRLYIGEADKQKFDVAFLLSLLDTAFIPKKSWQDERESFTEEWKKELMKWNKPMLIDFIKNILIERDTEFIPKLRVAEVLRKRIKETYDRKSRERITKMWISDGVRMLEIVADELSIPLTKSEL